MNPFVRIAMASGVVDVREDVKNKDGLNLRGTLASAALAVKNSKKDLNLNKNDATLSM